MTEPGHLAALYNATEIILWVEDLVTAAYLRELWGHDPLLKFYIGGGHETLKAVVEDARRSGRRGLFGIRDRDFGPTNRPRWSSPGEIQFFVLETFEVECFLLDPAALAACRLNTGKRSEAEIRARLDGRAGELLWWMACRRVIAQLREARHQAFPAHPKRNRINSREAAEKVLLENDWVKKTVPGLPGTVTAERLCDALTQAHAYYNGHHVAGTWPGVFSGKELVGELMSWVWTRRRPGDKNTAGEDLAKTVAQAQRGAGRVPAEMVELHTAIVARRLA